MWEALTAFVTPFTVFLTIAIVGAVLYVGWVESKQDDK